MKEEAVLAGILIAKSIYLEEDAMVACILIVRSIYLLLEIEQEAYFKYRNQ